MDNSISGFLATHRLDLKILLDCVSPGDHKSCDDKIETLLSCGSTYTCKAKFVVLMQMSWPLYGHTHVCIYIPMVNS